MKIRLPHIVRNSEFAKNAILVTLGTGVAQILPLLAYPFLSRIFSPEDFGLFATLTAITAIITVLATAKYELSILIARTKIEAINIIYLVLILSSVFLILVFVVFTIFSHQISEWLNNPLLSNWLLFTPVSAFSIIIYKLYNEWSVKNKQFKDVSYSKIVNATMTTSGSLVMGVVKFVKSGLFLGDTLGRVLTAAWCVWCFMKEQSRETINISIKRIIVLSKRYRNFPKYSLPEGLVDTLNSNLSIFAITSFFVSSDVGYFSMANTVLALPSSIISLAVMDVFRQKANEEWMLKGNCLNIYVKTVKVMFYIVTPFSILCFFIMPDLFSFVLGENWRTAGEYARILLPNVAILFVFQVVSAVFIIANKMKVSFYWQVFSISLTMISLAFGGLIFKDMQKTLLFYCIARIIANGFRFYLTYKYAKN